MRTLISWVGEAQNRHHGHMGLCLESELNHL